MRRSEKEITNKAELDDIICRARVCHIALTDNGTPYIVPVCFGYEGSRLYFHSAGEGRKLECLKKDCRVCFEMDVDSRIVTAGKACNWSMKYRSVVGFGQASVVVDSAEKVYALNSIMRHYAGPTVDYDDTWVARTTVVKIEIERLSGKKSGY